MYLADCHTHTCLSPDSGAPLMDQAQAALSAGLNGLWVTDHCDLVDGGGRPAGDFPWPAALTQLRQVREVMGDKLEVRLGLELGSAPYDPARARAVLAGAGEELDFVLGSLHNFLGAYNDRDYYYADFTGNPHLCRETMENVLRSTWALIRDCPDCYDSLAHIDYPLRYMVRDGHDVSILGWEDEVRPILREVARSGHALEVNTCRGTDLAHWPEVLRWFKECGGELVTVGSDAHSPRDVGRGVREAAGFVRDAGLRCAVFRGRKPCVVPG